MDMNKLRYFLLAFATSLAVSCGEADEETFDATLYGSVIDSETGERILQEEPNGSSIQLITADTGVVRTQTSIPFKMEGSYHFTRIHSGNYMIQAPNGNFYPPEPRIMNLKGDTQYDLVVQPYARIKEEEISYDATKAKIRAKFHIDSKEKISKMVLLCNQSSRVSWGLQTASAQDASDKVFEVDEEASLVLKTQGLTNGKYFVRIGVLAQNAPTNMYNYSPSYPVTVDNTQYDGKLDGEIDSYARNLYACWDGLQPPVNGIWTDYVNGFAATMDVGIVHEGNHISCSSQGGHMNDAICFPTACTFEILVRNPTNSGCFLIDARESDSGYQAMYLENVTSVQTYSSFGGEKSFSVPKLDDGKVHLLSVVITATGSRMYCDGVQADTSEGHYGGEYSGHIHIGERFTGSSKYTGDLYSFRFYDRALNSEEILTNYQNDIQRFHLE
jgi:hypothetical protein